MGSVTIRDMQSVGEVCSEVEYTFSDSSDFFAWDELKHERLNNAVKSFTSALDFSNSLDESTITDINIKKKEVKH